MNEILKTSMLPIAINWFQINPNFTADNHKFLCKQKPEKIAIKEN